MIWEILWKALGLYWSIGAVVLFLGRYSLYKVIKEKKEQGHTFLCVFLRLCDLIFMWPVLLFGK
jgi:membrane protein insertase Oxa1/YidC/SpoIIIJ